MSLILLEILCSSLAVYAGICFLCASILNGWSSPLPPFLQTGLFRLTRLSLPLIYALRPFIVSTANRLLILSGSFFCLFHALKKPELLKQDFFLFSLYCFLQAITVVSYLTLVCITCVILLQWILNFFKLDLIIGKNHAVYLPKWVLIWNFESKPANQMIWLLNPLIFYFISFKLSTSWICQILS